ncbi:MAG: alpha/beta hydrolase [Deltaproteobacteria bacterium]|nr:alpha/beta hydrolase [Deltaproteobacteria bacterium]
MPRISIADWTATGRTFDYRGHAIFTRTAGSRDAEPLVLIHGFPTASWDWEALWPELEKRYRLLTLDMIGFGLSAKPRDYDYSLRDQAELFERFLVNEGVRAYHVLAHDYGDTVAQELLARQGEPGERPELKSVVFLNGGLFPEMHRPVLMQKLLVSPLGPLLARLSNRRTLAANMRKIFGPDTQPDDALIDAFWSLLSRNEGTAVMPKLLGYMAERRVHRERWVGALQHAKVPLAVIDGATDPISGAHMVERYRELVPNPRVTLLERIGHYPQVEAPEAVLKAYLAFRGSKAQ